MAYSILIADDEAMMRNGLQKLIKWKEMDFEVVAVVEDGQQAIDYLSSHEVNVLLTDIRMGSVSGIDVVKYVAEHKLPIKTVIISGYKEFEYARQAIRYGVSEYLLKPLSMVALKQTFYRLRDMLNEESLRTDRNASMMERYQMLCENAISQFYVELATGAITNPSSFERRVRLLGLTPEEIERRCCIAEIKSANMGYALSENDFESIAGALQMCSDKISYYMTRTADSCINGLFVEKKSNDELAPWYNAKGRNEFAEKAKHVICMLTGYECDVRILNAYDSLLELMKAQQDTAIVVASRFRIGDEETHKRNHEFFDTLRAIKHLIMSYIIQKECQCANNELDAFYDMALKGGTLFATDQLIHLFSVLIEKCSSDDMNLKDTLWYNISFVELAAQTIENQRRWAHNQLNYILGQLEMNTMNTDPILKAQDYIKNHYMDAISLGEIADKVYLNPAYFSRLFKEKTGNTYIRYLTDVRINAAAEMLKNGDALVYDICHDVGYTNLNHFYKLFRQAMGCSPTEYRERNIEK